MNDQPVRNKSIDRLYTLQVKGPIADMIIKHYASDYIELDKLYSHVLKRRIPKAILETIKRLTKDQLIRIVKESSVPISAIEKVYEQYRYGYRVSFNLFCISGKPPTNIKEIQNNLTKIDIKQLLLKAQKFPENADMDTLLKTLPPDEQPEIKAVHLDFKIINHIGNNIIEIPFSYERRHLYIESKYGDLQRIYELAHGFIWINSLEKFVAVHTKDAIATNIAIMILEKAFNVKLKKPLLAKEIVDKVFNKDTGFSASWRNPIENYEMPRWVRAKDKNIFSKKLVLSLEKTHERTGSSYEERVGTSRMTTISLSEYQGKLLIGRTLTTSELQTLAPLKINQLIQQIQFSKTDKLKDIMQKLNARRFMQFPILSSSGSQQREAFLELYSAIKLLKNKNESSTSLSISATFIQESFPNLFMPPIVEGECDLCHETSLPVCQCGNRDLTIDYMNHRLFCIECEKTYSLPSAQLRCWYDNDHKINIGLWSESVIIRPNTVFYENINQIAQEIDSERLLSDEDLIYIKDKSLKLTMVRPNKVEILPTETDVFAPLKKIKLSQPEEKNLWFELRDMKEKCNHPKVETCENCVESKKNKYCLPKIFTSLVNFTVKPHSGYEFGDIRFKSSFNGKSLNFIGHIKRFPRNFPRTELRDSDPVGKEITTQFIRSLHDSKVDIIGIIIPLKLEASFRTSLSTLTADRENKKIMFIGKDELIKILKLYKEK